MTLDKPGSAIFLLATGILMTDIATGGSCMVSGSSRNEAAQQFTQRCDGQISDCDRHNNQWFCANEKIDTFKIEEWLGSAKPNVKPDIQLSAVPENSCVDPDGDGWGWNGTESCRIDTQTNSNNITTPTPSSDSCIDTDGDGWGWNGVASCRVVTATLKDAVQNTVQNTIKQVETDVELAVAENVAQSIEQNALPDAAQDFGTVDSTCAGDYHPSDITDLILATGQSNLTGAQTSVSASIDRFGKVIDFHDPDKPHPRVFAWTVDSYNNNNGTGWKVANLTQSWHDSNPGAGGIARNNFAFHFAKKVAESSGCRVVGFVVVSEGGRGISHWDKNAPGWNEVSRHLNDAMSAIGRTSIDGILWHQGESDWIADGTCYTGDRCHNEQPDYYPQKLYSRIANPAIANTIGQNALIDRLRRESWFSSGKPFIAAETVQAPVNIHLNKLNTDNDHWTACVRGDAESGLGIRADDPHKNHYNANGLRELGARYASAYLSMKKY